MSPDPFRSLDRVDPPDHWDEITRRAGHDDVDLDLGADPHLRPRRRAAALVAAAAVAALVAGATVAGVGRGDGDEDVTATDPPPAAVAGPCPFTLDPELVVPPLRPGAGDPEAPYHRQRMSSVQAPPTAPGSWGTLDDAGIPVTVAVYADADTAPAPAGVAVQEVPDDPDAVEVIAWRPLAGSATCRTAEVRVRLPLTDDDRAARDRGIDVDLSGYTGDPVPTRILRAVRLAATVQDPCTQLVDQGPPVATTGAATSGTVLAGEQADGRRFAVELEGDEVVVTVEGEDGGGGTTRPAEAGARFWSGSQGDAGVLVGWLPPDAVVTGVVRPDSTATSTGLVVWPEGELFAIPDVPEEHEVVHCTAEEVQAVLDAKVDDSLHLSEQDQELSAQIEREAAELQERLRCEADPTCAGVPLVSTAVETGEEVVVRETTGRGLCLVVDGTEVQCDADLDPAPTDPATARRATAPCCSAIWYGYLPEDAGTDSRRVRPSLDRADGSTVAADGSVNARFWVLPVPADGPEDAEEATIVYRWPDGRSEPAP